MSPVPMSDTEAALLRDALNGLRGDIRDLRKDNNDSHTVIFARIESIGLQVTDMALNGIPKCTDHEKTIDGLRTDVDALKADNNKGKGGLVVVASLVSATVAAVLAVLAGKLL
jgi:hypothetical protein